MVFINWIELISENKKVNSLVINSLLSSGDDSSQPINTCPPKSLKKWKKKNKKGEDKRKKKRSKCDVTIPEPKRYAKMSLLIKTNCFRTGFRSSTNSWEKLDEKLKEDSEILSQFPKV